MRLILLALAVTCALTNAQAQQTTNVPLNQSGWTDLGAGPLLFVAHGSGIASFAVSAATPTLSPQLALPIPSDRAQFVNTTQHIWGQAMNTLAVSVTTATGVTGD